MTTQQQLIQQNFNRASSSYLTHAVIQNNTAKKLMQQALAYIDSSTQIILDLGAGPGTLAHSNLQLKFSNPIIALDISLNMLKASSYPAKINADATNLPLENNSIDIIVSNLMLQWPQNKQAVFDEISRILKPNGKIIFTTLIDPSLNELNSSWSQLDDKRHTLEFLSIRQYTDLARQSKLKLLKQITWHEKLFFKDLLSLFKHFSQTGTSLPKATQQGLGGKNRLKSLEKIYPRETLGLPLSYHYLIQSYSKE